MSDPIISKTLTAIDTLLIVLRDYGALDQKDVRELTGIIRARIKKGGNNGQVQSRR